MLYRTLRVEFMNGEKCKYTNVNRLTVSNGVVLIGFLADGEKREEIYHFEAFKWMQGVKA